MIGLNAAVSLVERDLDVVTVEAESGPMMGSSGRGGSSLGLVDKQPGPMRELAFASIQAFQRRAELLGSGWLHLVGGLVPVRAWEEPDARRLAQSHEMVNWLDCDDLALATTLLDRRKLVGALYIEGEGRIDVGAFSQRATEWLRQTGRWTYRAGRVAEVVETAGHARVALAEGPAIDCDGVIVAPGYDAHGIARRLGSGYPVEPCRGVILVYSAPRSAGRDPIMLGLPYVQGRYSGRGAVGAVAGEEVSFTLESVPGSLRIGSSREYVGFGTEGTDAIAAKISTEASTFLTLRGTPEIMVCWRPVSATGVPAAGRVAGTRSVYCAVGFEGHGVCLAAALGEALAQYMLAGECPAVLAPFDPERDRRVQVGDRSPEARDH